MPIRSARRTNFISTIQQHIPKIFLIGGSQSGKTNFVKSFYSQTEQDSLFQNNLFIKFMDLGVDPYPIKFEGKKYTLWNANISNDENLLMWGKNSDLIVVFGDDIELFHHMSNLFPQIKVKMYNPQSKIDNLEANL